jgi:hypothetical protein
MDVCKVMRMVHVCQTHLLRSCIGKCDNSFSSTHIKQDILWLPAMAKLSTF